MHALIHHFENPMYEDEEGDPYLGFYYQLMDSSNLPITHLIGPYATYMEVEAACERAYKTDDY